MWKPIKEYEGYYEVSDEGSIRSVDRYIQKGKNIIKRKSVMLSLKKDGNGRLQVRLCRDGQTSYFLVHRIVAYNFIGDINGKVVDHIDDDYTNNKVTNLQIISQTDNMLKREIKIHDIRKLGEYMYSIRLLDYNSFMTCLLKYKI